MFTSVQSKVSKTFDTIALYIVLDLFYLNIILMSVKAKWSCVCLLNTWLSEMEAESVTGQVCNFPVFQMTASWMQTIILSYPDLTRWNLRNRLADVTLCFLHLPLKDKCAGSTDSWVCRHKDISTLWCWLTCRSPGVPEQRIRALRDASWRRKNLHKNVCIAPTNSKGFARIIVWTTPI